MPQATLPYDGDLLEGTPILETLNKARCHRCSSSVVPGACWKAWRQQPAEASQSRGAFRGQGKLQSPSPDNSPATLGVGGGRLTLLRICNILSVFPRKKTQVGW